MTAQSVMLGTHQTYIPTITQHGDTLVSSIVNGNQWYKNDVAIEGATGQTYIYTEIADYSVVVTYAAGGCGSSSEKLNIRTNASTVVKNHIECNVFPNPNNGVINLIFNKQLPETVQLELFTIDGKIVCKDIIRSVTENQVITFGSSNLPNGIYTLLIKTGKIVLNRLIIVHQPSNKEK